MADPQSATGAPPAGGAPAAPAQMSPNAEAQMGPTAEAGAMAVEAGGPAAGASSFATIYDEIITQRCSSCHASVEAGQGGLVMLPDADTAYANLVMVPAGTMGGADSPCASSGLNRVTPGDPDASLLYLKVTKDPGVCGGEMPPPILGDLTPENIEAIRTWILEGAMP
ncbi:MAG: hypothetical protein OXU20_29190 [Myxococcales bacterium]|nr:hypothetical protein [Myxococcales bacterium]MDD9966435.1 hypothetical protein [Myxococcales bacterium]